MPKREKSKRLQVVITEEQDSLLTKTAYHLSNPERLVSKSEVVRLGIELLNRAVEQGQLPTELLSTLDHPRHDEEDAA
ncbi:MAG: transcriptional regulator [Truepera sp.]|nr:transcriptional regulator [Truepera sp.]